MEKILYFLSAIFILFPATVFGAKAVDPVYNQTIQSMACADSSNSYNIEPLNCDSSGNISVTVLPTGSMTTTNDIVDIPAAGATDQTQLPSVMSISCVIQAAVTNAGAIYVGGSDVTNSSGAAEGVRLNQNDSLAFTIDNLSSVYVAADNAGDDVKYFCTQKPVFVAP